MTRVRATLVTLVLAIAIACSEPTTGPQVRTHVSVGDTIGIFLQVGPDSMIRKCSYIIATVAFDTDPFIPHDWTRDCVIGQKVSGPLFPMPSAPAGAP